jgi:hypothetical protein
VVFAGATAVLLAEEWGTRWSPDHVARGSGIAAVESRNVPRFTALDLAGTTEVTVTVGDERGVVVAADDNLIDLVTTQVLGETLVVDTNGRFTTKVPMTVDLTVPALDGVTLSGTGVVTVTNVKATLLTVRLSGTGAVSISGTAERLEVDLAGSGDILLQDLVARDVAATVSGFGRAEVHATSSLHAVVSGTGVIDYTGAPSAVSKKINGTGAITGADGP